MYFVNGLVSYAYMRTYFLHPLQKYLLSPFVLKSVIGRKRDFNSFHATTGNDAGYEIFYVLAFDYPNLTPILRLDSIGKYFFFFFGDFYTGLHI